MKDRQVIGFNNGIPFMLEEVQCRPITTESVDIQYCRFVFQCAHTKKWFLAPRFVIVEKQEEAIQLITESVKLVTKVQISGLRLVNQRMLILKDVEYDFSWEEDSDMILSYTIRVALSQLPILRFAMEMM
jgi:hypothetical protein